MSKHLTDEVLAEIEAQATHEADQAMPRPEDVLDAGATFGEMYSEWDRAEQISADAYFASVERQARARGLDPDEVITYRDRRAEERAAERAAAEEAERERLAEQGIELTPL